MEETGWTYNFSQFYHMVANLIWNIEKMSVSKLVGGTNRKGIKRGIGLRRKGFGTISTGRLVCRSIGTGPEVCGLVYENCFGIVKPSCLRACTYDI